MPDKPEDTNSSMFHRLSEAFVGDPSIETYVRLRRQYPNERFDISPSDRRDWLLANKDTLRHFGIPPELVAEVLDAKQAAICELSLLLLEKIIDRSKLEREGGSHLVSRNVVIGDSLLNYLAIMMLDALDWHDRRLIPPDLLMLLRQTLGGGVSEWDRKQRLSNLRSDAIEAALDLAHSGVEPSYRLIGKRLQVNASTVKRLFPDSAFIDWSKGFARTVALSKKSPRSERDV